MIDCLIKYFHNTDDIYTRTTAILLDLYRYAAEERFTICDAASRDTATKQIIKELSLVNDKAEKSHAVCRINRIPEYTATLTLQHSQMFVLVLAFVRHFSQL